MICHVFQMIFREKAQKKATSALDSENEDLVQRPELPFFYAFNTV